MQVIGYVLGAAAMVFCTGASAGPAGPRASFLSLSSVGYASSSVATLYSKSGSLAMALDGALIDDFAARGLAAEPALPSVIFPANYPSFGTADRSQSISKQMPFDSTAGGKITSLIFNNFAAHDSLQVATVGITAVPETSTFALLAGGLGAIGLVIRRRRRDF